MAVQGTNLGGLPPINSEGPISLDDIVKLAHLFSMHADNQLKQQEAVSKYGTPPRTIPGTPGTAGTPDITTTSKPLFAGLRGYQPVAGAPPMAPSVPINGESGDPSTGMMEEAQGRLMTNGIGATPTTWVKPGTPAVPGTSDTVIPGTPGSTELATKAGIAHLLDPANAATMMNQKGYQGIAFNGAKKEKPSAYFSETTGTIKDPTEITSPEEAVQLGYRPTDMDTALKLAKDYATAKIHDNSTAAGEYLKYYNTLVDIRPGRRTESQNTMISVLDDVLPGVVGAGKVFAVKKEAIAKQRTDYAQDKMKALDLIQQTQDSTDLFTDEEKQKRVRGILDKLQSEYGNIYSADFTTAQENKLLAGKSFFTKVKERMGK